MWDMHYGRPLARPMFAASVVICSLRSYVTDDTVTPDTVTGVRLRHLQTALALVVLQG